MGPIVMTMGDPAGIGPEIALAAWTRLRDTHPILGIGDARYWSSLANERGIPFEIVTTPKAKSDAFAILDRPAPGPIKPGTPNTENAAAIIDWIQTATELTRSGATRAVVTNPVSKVVLMEGAGFAFPGHTEFLAALDETSDVVMMLASPLLRVVAATIHIPIARVPEALTADGLATTIRITHGALQRDFGINTPRLAVAGLNPHAGEDGKIGVEEQILIKPLIKHMALEGMDLVGPMSADAMFHAEARQQYDAAICMYHDQALVPLKTLSFSDGTNVTLGLSFVRTSPDHGTAFDIAGKGTASSESLVAAIEMAADIAAKRQA